MNNRTWMIILFFSIIHYLGLTKTIYLDVSWMLKLLTWMLLDGRDDIRAWTIMAWRRLCMRRHGFVPYILYKFIRTLSFSYWLLWHTSFLTLYHILSGDYVHIQRFFVYYTFVSTLDTFLSLFDHILTTFSAWSLVKSSTICRVSTSFHPMITSINFANRAPCRYFV